MKKWYAFTAIFFSSYLVFLVATIPLSLVLNNIDLPKNVYIGKVSGSIWQGEITEASANNNYIEQIKTELSFWSLLIFSAKVDVTFGDAMLDGPEGKFTLTASSTELLLNDVKVFLSANDVAKQLPLPIPATAQGNVELTFAELKLNTEKKISCESAQGNVTWLRAGVVALDYNIKVGNINAELDCNKGDLIAKIPPKNNLGLSFDARLSLSKQKASGKGYIKPGAKFPAELRSALSFLGRPDKQGRYPLKF